jgi:hypothetical protein
VTRRRILVLCFDPVTDAMAGPAIRAWHLAEILARAHDVVLASTVAAAADHPAMEVRYADDGALRALVTWADHRPVSPADIRS